MEDSRHVLSHSIKEHNGRKSASHGQACLNVGQSEYSSASCRDGRSSSTYLQIFKSTVGRSSYSSACTHTRTHSLTHTYTHMHQQLTLLKMKHSHVMAIANKNLKPNGSKGLHYHTYKSLSVHSTSKPSRKAH